MMESLDPVKAGVYRASVVANDDPEGRGRLRVRVPAVTGVKAVTPWIWPIAPPSAAALVLPEVGSGVWVAYENGSVNHPVWIGVFGGLNLSRTRRTATYTTATLAAGGTEQGSIPLALGYRLLRITTSAPARVRLYGTTADRDADVSRASSTPPPTGLSIFLDYLTTSGSLTGAITPIVDGASLESTPATSVPITVTATNAGIVTVTLLWVRTE